MSEKSGPAVFADTTGPHLTEVGPSSFIEFTPVDTLLVNGPSGPITTANAPGFVGGFEGTATSVTVTDSNYDPPRQHITLMPGTTVEDVGGSGIDVSAANPHHPCADGHDFIQVFPGTPEPRVFCKRCATVRAV